MQVNEESIMKVESEIKMKTTTAIIIAVTIASPVFSQAKTEGRQLAELTFESVDEAGRGYVDQGQMSNFGEDIRVSMDANDDGKITQDEWLGWDFGFSNIAETQNKELAYRTALRVVFSFQDRDGNGEISGTEWRKAASRDFQQADLNGDALLDKNEFINGFPVINAIKAALKP